MDQESFFNGENEEENENNQRQPGHHRKTSSLTDAVNEALNREDVQSWIAPYLSIFTLHGGVGFVAGMAAKRMGSTSIKYVVTGAVCLQLLSYTGYVSIHYDKMKADIDTFASKHENNNSFQWVMQNIGPIAAGFGLGLHLG